jgi:hypothetical protein
MSGSRPAPRQQVIRAGSLGFPGSKKHAATVKVGATGGRETQAMGKSQISDADFAKALAEAITESRTFSRVVQDNGDGLSAHSQHYQYRAALFRPLVPGENGSGLDAEAGGNGYGRVAGIDCFRIHCHAGRRLCRGEKAEAGHRRRGKKQHRGRALQDFETVALAREALNKSSLARRRIWGWDARKATTRMVRPRRAEQCLPKEDATP